MNCLPIDIRFGLKVVCTHFDVSFLNSSQFLQELDEDTIWTVYMNLIYPKCKKISCEIDTKNAFKDQLKIKFHHKNFVKYISH